MRIDTIKNFIARACGRGMSLPVMFAFLSVLAALAAGPVLVFGAEAKMTPAEAAKVNERLQACWEQRQKAAEQDPGALFFKFQIEASPHVRRCQAAVAAKLGQKGRPLMLEALRDPDAQVRQAAVQGLLRLRMPADTPEILKAYRRETDKGVKASVARRLEWLEGAKPADLDAVVNDPDPKIRELAAGAKARQDARKARQAKKKAAGKAGKKR